VTLLVVALSASILSADPATAQELEPRLLTNVPVGMNFALFGYSYARGNILLDPAVPVEDLDSKLHMLVGGYVRSIDIAGMAGKVDVVVPFAFGDWQGKLAGQDTARSVDGFGDPRLRMSLTFVGTPALQARDFATYQQGTIAGASVQVMVPVGQYDSNKLLNLGSNRWVVRSLLGLSQAAGPWFIELYGGVWLFTDNNDFFGGSTLEQDPLWTAKTHLIRTLPKGRWLALDLGYGLGGRTTVDGEQLETRISTFRFGVTLAMPLAPTHTLRLTAATATRIERGPDYDAVAASYQHRWGGM
jgi:hypothetical protein